MLDFNNKKNILRRLRIKGEKSWYWRILCSIAAVFVRIGYDVACAVSMIFSDRHGNLLGIKGLGNGDRAERRMAEKVTERKARRQDDIVYVKRSVVGRFVSAVLAISFVFMFVPELGIDLSVFAADPPTVQVEGVGENWLFTPSGQNGASGQVGYYFEYSAGGVLNAEYQEAINLKVNIIDVIPANGAVKISWEAANNDGTKTYTYVPGYTQNGRAPVYASPVSDTEYIFEGLTPSANYSFFVIPETYLTAYRIVNVKDEEGTGTHYELVNGDTRSLPVRGTYDVASSTVTPNKTLATPANVKAELSAANDRIGISWEGVTDTDGNPPQGYVIWRRTYNNKTGQWGGYEIVGQVSGDELTYNDNNVIQGTSYQYYVMAYTDLFGQSDSYVEDRNGNPPAGIITSNKTAAQRIAVMMTIPPRGLNSLVNVVSNGKDSLIISWEANKNSNVDGYEVYRTTNHRLTEDDILAIEDETERMKYWNAETRTWDFQKFLAAYADYLGDTENTTWTDPLENKGILDNDARYYYYVLPFVGNSITNFQTRLYGPSKDGSGILGAKVGTPSWVSVEPGDGYIDLEWKDSDKNVAGYIIYYTQETNIYGEPPEPIGPVAIDVGNVTSWRHENLFFDDVYTYRVQAYYNNVSSGDGETRIYSEMTDPRTATVGLIIGIPQDVTLTTEDGKVTIKWDAVEGITARTGGYTIEVTELDSAGNPVGEPVIYDNITTTSRTITGLTNNVVYSFRVKAYKMVTGKRKDGGYSTPVSIKVGIPLGTPQDLVTTTTDGQVVINWSKVSGATGYKLYILGPGDTEPREIDVTNPPYVHAGLNNGDIYEYWVVPYKLVNGATVTGPESVHLKQKVGEELGIPQNLKATTKDGEITVSWDKLTGAEGYILEFRKPGQGWDVDGTAGRSLDVSGNSFNHTRLNNGDVYEYRVKAYKTVNGIRVYGQYSNIISMTVGSVLNAPKDFKVVTTDGKATLSWTKVTGAEGYIVYAYSSGRAYQFDVSKTSYEHTGLANGDSWTYYVVAYKTVNGERTYSDPTKSITVKIGISLNAALDLKATAGNHQIDLTWKAVTGAEGYVVYLYNSKTMEFEPIAEVSGTKYSHIGLKNGTKYTYMVAPFKTIDGERFYGEYSIAVSAIPTTGSTSDVDRELNVKGTAPYGISHSEYMSAGANHDAFDESVDVYFTTNQESTKAVRDVLKNYANGLSSFVIYPFDISIYREGTKIEVDPADGYTVTITMPIPDVLIAYRDYLTVVHINDHDTTIGDDEIAGETIREVDWYDYGDQRLEVLPCAIVDIDNVWCVQFKCASFSPYALVIYKEHIQDVSAGFGIFDGSFAGTFNTGGLLLFTALPDIMPHNKKLRVVRGGSKRYRIKNIEKK